MTAELAVDDDGWVASATRQPSPNFDERPGAIVPTLIVIHNISLPPGEFGGPAVDQLFANTLDFDAHPFYAHLTGVRVSSHFLIRRTGELVQFVSCDARAWHAGASDFLGRSRCNDFSVGIELEGTDHTPFEAAQYRVLGSLVRALTRHYPVSALAGHSDIAPGRKTDPGPLFDWRRLKAQTGLSDIFFPYVP